MDRWYSENGLPYSYENIIICDPISNRNSPLYQNNCQHFNSINIKIATNANHIRRNSSESNCSRGSLNVSHYNNNRPNSTEQISLELSNDNLFNKASDIFILQPLFFSHVIF